LTVDVDVIEQIEPPAGFDPARLIELIRFALGAEKAHGYWVVAVVLTSDKELRALHRDFMGNDVETDVMTFPTADEHGHDAHGGEIVISVDRAADQAPEFGLTPWEEVRFLALHGVMHLLGWDDHADDERSSMLARQRELIDKFDQSWMPSSERS